MQGATTTALRRPIVNCAPWTGIEVERWEASADEDDDRSGVAAGCWGGRGSSRPGVWDPAEAGKMEQTYRDREGRLLKMGEKPRIRLETKVAAAGRGRRRDGQAQAMERSIDGAAEAVVQVYRGGGAGALRPSRGEAEGSGASRADDPREELERRSGARGEVAYLKNR